MRAVIGLWGLAVGSAALWTGVQAGFTICSMTGFLPPHYGYSAYAVVPLLFISNPAWLRGSAAATLLLSQNRASWIGAIAGWASLQGGRDVGAKLLLLMVLAAGAVIGGNALKPRSDNDSVRVHIWKAALHQVARHPEGVGRGVWGAGVDGNLIDKAHSDVLQLAIEQGALVAVLTVLAVLLGLYSLPAGEERAVVVALTVQSVIDNRLHHPACAALYAAAWVCAWRARRTA